MSGESPHFLRGENSDEGDVENGSDATGAIPEAHRINKLRPGCHPARKQQPQMVGRGHRTPTPWT